MFSSRVVLWKTANLSGEEAVRREGGSRLLPAILAVTYPEAQWLALRLELDPLAETRTLSDNGFRMGHDGCGESCSEIRVRPADALLTNLAGTGPWALRPYA